MRSKQWRVRVVKWPLLCAGTVTVAVVAAGSGDGTLPPVPHPYENAGNEAQRVLGKMLFFEEQLSSDGTVACATCHVMTAGGTDPRRGRNPGSNGVFGDLGDVMGSPGVPVLAADGALVPSGPFGMDPQVTGRTAPTPFVSMYEQNILWDGRAKDTFVDPTTGGVAIATGGALESQALLPLTNSVEMGHAGRTLDEVTAKLENARPLAFSTAVPDDVKTALSGDPTYKELFQRAYGDDAVTPARIAMAIATYERTLVPDGTKYDRYVAGDASALGAAELRGLQALTTAQCVKCHAPPLFTDGSFRATGVRGPADDLGLAAVSKDMADRGKFKVPTLRNVALKQSFFHDGQRTRLEEALDFYAAFGAPVVNGTRSYSSVTGSQAPVPHVQIVDNQDPILATIKLTPQMANDILAFLRGALVDERVASGQFPFDSTTMGVARDDLPVVTTQLTDPNTADAGKVYIVTRGPAVEGNDEFAVTAIGGTEGQVARLVWWFEPIGDRPIHVSDPVVFSGSAGQTYAGTKISLRSAKAGERLRFAWRISDPNVAADLTTTEVGNVVVGAGRPRYEDGAVVAPELAATVDGADAFIESAKYSVNYGRRWYSTPTDTFSATAWLDHAAEGVDLRAGSVTLTIGGAAVLSGLALDGAGRISSPNASGRYDRTTGRLKITARALDLAATVLAPTSVPIRIDLDGLGLDHPSVATTLRFATSATLGRPTKGTFQFDGSGTSDGAFHVVAAKATPTSDGRYRVRIEAALDQPGQSGSWSSGSAEFSAGAGEAFHVAQDVLGTSPNGGLFSFDRTTDVKRLQIDVVKRKLYADIMVSVPGLASAARGSTVPLPLVFRTTPDGATGQITFRATAYLKK